MDRRDLIKAFGAIAVSASFLSACGRSETGELEAIYTPSFYGPTVFALVARVSDVLIPTTQTPGALAVGVPEMLDHLMLDWADAATGKANIADWGKIDAVLSSTLGQPNKASDADFTKAVQALDAQAFGEGRDEHGAYRRQKSLIAQAYYWSEPGATEELQYELNPVELIVCGPIDEIGRTWFR
ncbi:MAG: hypothetical protein COA69_10965 [Robiginitomaculum sp.]|nr:MAG: hypothetical protein COA69_10965 [Robiginitomaculum sp.]